MHRDCASSRRVVGHFVKRVAGQLNIMARVTEVVGWALDSGMYVILNIHWDGGWFSRFANEEDRDECFYKYERFIVSA